jgi:hypothetical protein
MTDARTASTTRPTPSTRETVSRLLAQIEDGTGLDPALFADDAAVDAIVPNWRMAMTGPTAIVEQLSGWYAVPGHLEDVTRTPLPDGELVELTRTWTEEGVLHTSRQSHHLAVDASSGRIVADRIWCGGRWPAPLVAEMAGA